MENDEIEIDLLRLLNALWKKAWAIVLAAAVFGGAVFAYGNYTYVPQYTATTILYTRYENSDNSSQSSLSVARSLVDTCISLLNTRMIQEEVIQKANLDMTCSQLGAMISAASVNKTELFTVKVTADDAEKAALIADTLAQILPEKVAMVNANSYVGIIDSALVTNSPNGNDTVQNAVKATVLGAFLVSFVIVIMEIVVCCKERKTKKEND